MTENEKEITDTLLVDGVQLFSIAVIDEKDADHLTLVPLCESCSAKKDGDAVIRRYCDAPDVNIDQITTAQFNAIEEKLSNNATEH
jgi:hypothetical protein